MLSLVLSIATSAMIAVIMRLSTGKVRNQSSMLLANYMVCTLLGALYADLQTGLPAVPGFSTALMLGIVNGAFYLSGFTLFQYNTEKNGIVLSSIFMKLGLLVPLAVSILFFHELPSPVQIVGVILALCAIVLINYRKGTSGARPGLMLLLLLLMGGCCDAMSKVYQVLGRENLSDLFLFFTYGTAFILCGMVVIGKKERPGRTEFLYGALIGIPNFFSSKFMLMALTDVPGVVAYPTFSVSTMLLVTLAGTLFFREKLTNNQWIALGIIVIALTLLNL